MLEIPTRHGEDTTMSMSTPRDNSKLGRLVGARRKAVQTSPNSLFQTRLFAEDQTLPLVVEPGVEDVDLIDWSRRSMEWIDQKLDKHGALLFRGFKVPSAEKFEELSRVIAPELVNYMEGSSPRIMVTERVYTSTEYPPEFFVSMHNELSYAHKWPSRIFFYCVVEPEQGGETPIADSRRVLELLPERLKQRFIDKKVMYVRNLHGGRGAGLAWQTVFETDNRSVVESYCREGDIDFEWTSDGGLRTRQIRPAIVRHPRTGELVWFNQVDQFHPSNLEPEVAKSMLKITAEEDLPINAYFGDGSPLDAGELAVVRDAFREAMVVFPWRLHDVLVMDNMLAAHGRMPFSGPRRVVVTMGSPVGLEHVGLPTHEC